MLFCLRLDKRLDLGQRPIPSAFDLGIVDSEIAQDSFEVSPRPWEGAFDFGRRPMSLIHQPAEDDRVAIPLKLMLEVDQGDLQKQPLGLIKLLKSTPASHRLAFPLAAMSCPHFFAASPDPANSNRRVAYS